MSALSHVEAARLTRFIAALVAPVEQGAHTGVARACLASRVRWPADDLRFLRAMVVRENASPADWARLTALVDYGREHAR